MPSPDIIQTKEGIWVLRNDSHISRWIEQHGSLQHDYQTLPIVLEHINKGDHIVDAGAFVGDTAKPFLDRIGQTGLLHCFEPNPAAFECLRLNLPIQLNVRFVETALSDTSGVIGLEAGENAGGSHLSAGSPVKVRTIALDSFELSRLDFLKLDVEGCELRALRGAEKTISKFHPKMLIEINHGALERQGAIAQDIYTWLEAHGYEWHEVVPHDGANTPQTDILCTHG